jgi:UDP-3-O-[3-hydroxymyristoyl] glucosamine N-acyltransferase
MNNPDSGISASQVLDDFKPQGLITEQQGPDNTFSTIQPVETCGTTDLVFANSENYLEEILNRKPAITVTDNTCAERLTKAGLCVLISSNVKLAQALLRQKYTDIDFYDSEWGQRHESAVIHPTAVVPETCVIGPGAVIGKNVNLGEKCVVMANSVIEHDTTIGSETIIHPNVVVGWGSKIGNRVFLKSGCIIGSEGYGYAQDQQRKSYRIPQQGIVVIEDDCSIGTNDTIDRAAFEETRIGAGCKFDSLVHVAHNVMMGKDCLILSQTAIAGSTQIGDRLIASGQTGILDHLKITNDVVLLHRAGVTQDVTESGMYAYLPLQPLKTYIKNAAIMRKLGEMKKTLSQLRKKIM